MLKDGKKNYFTYCRVGNKKQIEKEEKVNEPSSCRKIHRRKDWK